MPRLHQLNKLHYLQSDQSDMLISMATGDALVLIEEAVLKVAQDDPILDKAKDASIPIYVLDRDAQAHGTSTSANYSYRLISNEQWLDLTAQYDQHTSW